MTHRTRALSAFVLPLALCLFSCTRIGSETAVQASPESRPQEETEEAGFVPGMVRIKASEDLYHRLEGNGLRGGNPEMDAFLDEIGAESITPVFRDLDPRFAKRHHKAGLHLWFTVVFDKKLAVTRAFDAGKRIPGVDIIEMVPDIEAPKEQVVFASPLTLRGEGTGLLPGEPDDTRYREQWHLRNTEQVPGFLKGVDVNVLEAWSKGVTGSPDVIVAVLDGGVQTNHPDLEAHIWTNPNPKRTDEYGKDLHGFNFNTGVTRIDPDNHGTHVAGLIGAIRNNHLGVAGVAGGDGSDKSGVRIMSCQIFGEVNSPEAVLNAFIYAADNGAVIANNSWGTGPTPGPDMITESFKTSIDYFTDNAGCDDEGNQLESSPMKGGLAIFAAGNQDSEIWYNPGSYSRAVAVASVGPTAQKAVYSNYGEWVDISGPGGDMTYGNPEGLILSTVTQGMYGYMQGTSQACPIVSGVAALIVSKFGGKGFTNADLRARLLGSLRPFDIDARSPEYRGKIGSGIADAGKALRENRIKAPKAVEEKTLKVTPGHDEIAFSWMTVEDEDDGTAISYVLFYSKEKKLSKELLGAPGVRKEIFNAVEHPGAGETFQAKLKGLALGTPYHFALAGIDRWGQLSDFIFFDARTLSNHLPELALPEGFEQVTLTGSTVRTLEITVTDADKHDWTYALTGETKGITHHRDGDKILIDFRKSLPAGRHTVTLTVSDPFGSSKMEIPFDVTGNSAPALIRTKDEIVLPLEDKDFSLDLSEYFNDPDGDALSFEGFSFDPEIAYPVLDGSKLSFSLTRLGTAHIEITAEDPSGKSAKMRFTLRVVNDGIVLSAYPVPVLKGLHIRLSESVHTAEIEILTPLGGVARKKFVTVRHPEDRKVTLDLTDLSGGDYILSVKASGKVYRQNILKN